MDLHDPIPLKRDPDPAAGFEAALLAALARGEAAAFWPLWQKHSRRLFVVCLAEMGGNRADAEDAHAQAMMCACRKLPGMAPRVRDVGPWLARLTSNLCRDLHRRRERSLRTAGQWHALVRAEPVCPPPEAPACECAEVDPCAILACLPPRLRSVFVMRFMERLPYREIAGRLQLQPATVRKRVQEGRRLLRAWRQQGPAEPAGGQPAPGAPPCTREADVRAEAGCTPASGMAAVRRPGRERQKIATLRAYVAEHPAGWKKRLALADLLYQTGAWDEAATCYRAVLDRRPGLREAAARLEEIDGALELAAA